MSKLHSWGRLFLAMGLLVTMAVPAHAYLDPGTGSVIFTIGLAPVLIFLAWLGRRIIRVFIRSKKEQSAEDEGKQDAEA